MCVIIIQDYQIVSECTVSRVDKKKFMSLKNGS